MIHRIVGLFISMAFAASGASAAEPQGEKIKTRIQPPQPIGEQATVAFTMRPDKAYGNGENREKISVRLLEVPGLAECSFQQNSSLCVLSWRWDKALKAQGLDVQIPELPGPEEYFVLFTWDAKKGQIDGYVNGTYLRLPGTDSPPWTMKPEEEIVVLDGPFEVSNVSAEPKYLSETEASERVPPALRDRRAELFGLRGDRPPLEIESRLGKTLYESALDRPEAVADWVMEGPAIVKFANGWMEMASERPDGPEGHFVYWCPKDFPDSLVAEWEVQPVSKYGLCIVFFAAKGEHGEDIFDPKLPKRVGVFSQYTKGAINSYHVSYYANTPDSPGRITSNLRKNNKFYLISNGPPGISPGSTSAHKARLVKDKAHIQFLVDGRVIIDYTDDGKRYGPVYHDGKIALRQMQWMVARYRNFRVWELKE